VVRGVRIAAIRIVVKEGVALLDVRMHFDHLRPLQIPAEDMRWDTPGRAQDLVIRRQNRA
jgi:hypothetical protein